MIVSPELPITAAQIDLSTQPEAEREKRYAELLAAESAHVFNLERGPLVRVQLVRLAPEKYAFVFNAHHLVCDGWSCDVFLLDLAAAYSARREGRADELPAPMPFHEYQQWETEMHRTPEFAADAAYWLDKYRTIPNPLDLPADRPRPDRRSHGGAAVEVRLPATFPESLQKLGAEHGATLFSVLFAGFQTLLFRLSGETDLTIGIPSAGQNLAGGEHLIGHCVNMLPVRSALAGEQSFSDLLAATQTLVIEAFEHQRVTFGWLLQKLVVPRRPGRIPLISVTFNLDPRLSQLQFAGLRHRLEANPPTTSQFDLGFNCDTTPDGFRIICTYNTDLFDPGTIRRWLDLYRAILETAAARPGMKVLEINEKVLEAPEPVAETPVTAEVKVPIAEDGERIAMEWNGAVTAFPSDRGIHQLFEAQVARRPDAVAIDDHGRELTYGELNARANRLARHLRSLGLDRGACAGVCMERSLEFVVSVLAILKAGGTYVPLDPSYPAERLGWMLADTKTEFVLSREAVGGALPKEARLLDFDQLELGDDGGNLDLTTSGEDVAYVMFTSGSTGRPKGAAISHRGISRLVIQTDYIEFLETDIVAHCSNTAFDAATFEIWGALLNGVRLTVVDKKSLLSPRLLQALLQDGKVTVLFITTPLFHQMARVIPTAFGGLRYLIVGGDVLDPQAAGLVLESSARPRRFVNGYGPTETTTFAVCHLVTNIPADTGRIPIGRPIANTAVYVLDENLAASPCRCAGRTAHRRTWRGSRLHRLARVNGRTLHRNTLRPPLQNR